MRISDSAVKTAPTAVNAVQLVYNVNRIIVRCLSGLNVHFCKKSPKLAQMTFDRYLSNPGIGRTFWGGLTPSN